MAAQYEINNVLLTLTAGEALNAGALVTVNSNGQAVNATAGYGIGVTTESASSGETVTIDCVGAVDMVRVNAATTNIAAGDALKWDSSNKVFVKASSGDFAVAIALEGASADGVQISAVVGIAVTLS